MLNLCCFIGNLGRDPEVVNTQNGSKIVKLNIAVSERWKDRNTGEQKERTNWVPVVIFNEGLGGVAERYLRKGSKCYVSGQFEVRKWTDQSGQDRYSTEIVLRFDGKLVLLDRKGEGPAGGAGEAREGAENGGSADRSAGAGRSSYSRQAKEQHTPRGGGGGGFDDDLDSEIPF